MSLYGALFTGISGLNANSRALAATSNNIANVNTVGYKSDTAQFSTLLTSQASNSDFSAGGVRAIRLQNIDQQGLVQASSSNTDLAITGAGFFVVSRSADATGAEQQLFTRSGAFRPDGDGFLRNSAGFYLRGWLLDDNGDIPANRADLGPINLNDLTGTADPTDEINLRANLQSSETAFTGTYAPGTPANNMANGTVDAHFERTLEIFDSQGGAQPVRLAFLKTAANTWQYEFIYDGDPANITTGAGLPIGSGTITFNTDGTLATPVGGTTTLNVPFSAASGLASQNITVSFGTPNQLGGVTQFDTTSTLISGGVNGALFGGVTGVNVTEEGVVVAVFDNGVQRNVYKLPLGLFANPNGLIATTGNAYMVSEESGEPSLVEANTGGGGIFASRALEASTVDLAKEFTDLITTQRAYSAATRIITTSDEMLEELVRIKR